MLISDEAIRALRNMARVRLEDAAARSKTIIFRCDEAIAMLDEIARLRAENDRLRAGRLRAETLETARSAIPVLSELAKDFSDDEECAWCNEALADLDRCYPPEEV